MRLLGVFFGAPGGELGKFTGPKALKRLAAFQAANSLEGQMNTDRSGHPTAGYMTCFEEYEDPTDPRERCYPNIIRYSRLGEYGGSVPTSPLFISDATDSWLADRVWDPEQRPSNGVVVQATMHPQSRCSPMYKMERFALNILSALRLAWRSTVHVVHFQPTSMVQLDHSSSYTLGSELVLLIENTMVHRDMVRASELIYNYGCKTAPKKYRLRPLAYGERVIYRNGDCRDLRVENLLLVPQRSACRFNDYTVWLQAYESNEYSSGGPVAATHTYSYDVLGLGHQVALYTFRTCCIEHCPVQMSQLLVATICAVEGHVPALLDALLRFFNRDTPLFQDMACDNPPALADGEKPAVATEITMAIRKAAFAQASMEIAKKLVFRRR